MLPLAGEQLARAEEQLHAAQFTCIFLATKVADQVGAWAAWAAQNRMKTAQRVGQPLPSASLALQPPRVSPMRHSS